MKRHAQLVVALLLTLATLFNSACAPTADGRLTQAQGTGIGVVGGALVGALVGAATGNRDNIYRFAAAGAVVGGAAGYGWGTRVAQRKARYAHTEDWLDQEIAQAHQSNSRAYAYNASLRRRVADLDRKVAAARAARNQAAMRALKGQVAQLSREAKAENQKAVETTNLQKAVLSDASARQAANYGAYQKEANAFSKVKAERGQLVGRLASLENSLDR